MAQLIPRLQLFEIGDQSWFPGFLRARVQDALALTWTLQTPLQLSSPAHIAANVLIKNLGKNLSEYAIIDFCAGGGGPTPSIEHSINTYLCSQGQKAADVILTDLHPNIEAWERITSQNSRITYVGSAVDASAAPRHLVKRDDGKKTLRLFNLSFHHFDDKLAQAILRDTVETSQGFAIFELQDRSFSSAVTNPLLGLGVLLLAPWNPPNTWPIVGNGIVFLQPRQKLFKWFTKCIERHGHETLGISVPSLPPGVIISDPANLEYVFKHDSIFGKGDFFKDRLQDLFGSGIVNVDGELWKRQRKAGSQFLSATNLKILSEIELPRIIEAAIEDLDSKANRRTLVDLEEVNHEITTQLMGKMAYGMEMHANDEFMVAFDYASGVTARRFQNPLWFLTESITGSKLRKAMRTVQAFGRRLVAENLATGPSEEKTDVKMGSRIPKNLIYALLQNLGNEALVADSALNFLSAGKDTVAQALTWTLYLFMKNPEVVQTLCQRVGESGNIDPSTTAHSHVLAAFYESLRLYPPIPFEIKQAQESTALPDGTILPQGTIVVWCTWAMNRSKHLWGDDALDYRLERWLRDGKFTPRSAAEFPVFQGGARLCLGKKMAELIAVQVITSMIRRFEFVPAFDGEKTSVTHLTLPMKGGLHAYVKSRDLGDI